MTESNRRWWTLAGTSLGLFVLMLDSTVVTLALPDMQRDLDASTAGLQWVLNAYLLVLSMLVITFGRLGDMFGRRLVFVAGLGAFAAGTVVAAAAPSIGVLVAGRVLQGAGGAAMVTLSLAIVSDAFPAAERPRALGIWAAVSAAALAIGPLVGGILIEALSWRWIFWIDLPLLAAAVVITLMAARESRDEGAGHRIDVAGLVTLSAGLGGIVLALVQGKGWGFGSAVTLGVLAIGLAALVAFWFVEHRVAQPIVEFGLFRNGPYLGASAAAFGLLACYWSVMFFQPQYLQDILDYSAVLSGLLILPLTAPMMLISPFAGRLIARFGARPLMTLGMLLALASVAIQTRMTATTGYGLLLPAFLLFGIALGLVYAPMSTAAMEALPRAKAGIAAGVLAMNRMVAGALGLAVMGAVFQHLQQEKLTELVDQRTNGVSTEQGVLDGLLAGSDSAQQELAGLSPAAMRSVEEAARETYSYALANSMWVLVGIAAVTALLTWIYVRDAPAAEDVSAPPPGPHPQIEPAGLHRAHLHV